MEGLHCSDFAYLLFGGNEKKKKKLSLLHNKLRINLDSPNIRFEVLRLYCPRRINTYKTKEEKDLMIIWVSLLQDTQEFCSNSQ